MQEKQATGRRPQTETAISNESTLIKVLSFTADRISSLASESSVVGDAMSADGATVFPVSSVSVGFAGGGADVVTKKGKSGSSPAGTGAKLELHPSCFVVIRDGRVKIVSAERKGPAPAVSETAELAAGAIKSLMSLKKRKKAEPQSSKAE